MSCEALNTIWRCSFPLICRRSGPQGSNRHLAGCAACASRFEEYREMIAALGGLSAEPFAAAALPAVRANVLRQIRRRRAWKWSAAAAAPCSDVRRRRSALVDKKS